MNRNTGVLRLQLEIQSNSPLQFHFPITATDDGLSCLPLSFSCRLLTTRRNIIVSILPINKQAPRFASSICGGILYIPENKLLNFNLNIYDEDRGEYGIIKSQIVNRINGRISSDFFIYPYLQNGSPLSISIRSNKTFDYDAQSNNHSFLFLFSI